MTSFEEILKSVFEAGLRRLTGTDNLEFIWIPEAERSGARMDGPRPRAADDVDAIFPEIKKLELCRLRKCFQKAGLSSGECWCIRPGEVSLPCSSASDAGEKS